MKNYGFIDSAEKQKIKWYTYQIRDRLEDIFDWIFYTNPRTCIINNLEASDIQFINEQLQPDTPITNLNMLDNMQWTVDEQGNWTANLLLSVDILNDQLTVIDHGYIFDPRYLRYHQGVTVTKPNSYGAFVSVEKLRDFYRLQYNTTTHTFQIAQKDWQKLVTYLDLITDIYGWGFDTNINTVGGTDFQWWLVTASDGRIQGTFEQAVYSDNIISAEGNQVSNPKFISFTSDREQRPDTFFTAPAYTKRLEVGTTIISIHQPLGSVEPQQQLPDWNNYLFYTDSTPMHFVPQYYNNSVYFTYTLDNTKQFGTEQTWAFFGGGQRFFIANVDNAIRSWDADRAIHQYANITSVKEDGSLCATWQNNTPLQSEIHAEGNNIQEVVFADVTISTETQIIANKEITLYTITMNEKLPSDLNGAWKDYIW